MSMRPAEWHAHTKARAVLLEAWPQPQTPQSPTGLKATAQTEQPPATLTPGARDHARGVGRPRKSGRGPSLLYLSAGLGRHLKRGLERPPLLGGQDGPGPFGALMVLAVLGGSFPCPVGGLAETVFIVTFA